MRPTPTPKELLSRRTRSLQSPEEDTPIPGDTDDSTETSPDTPDEDTPPTDEDLPTEEGSNLELDSPEG